MTAKEIRKLRDESVDGLADGTLTEESLTAYFLAEIAAQLAEMNERATRQILTRIEKNLQAIKNMP